MGTYHTFFVATSDELDRLFPGWQPVKPEKIVVQRLNPFTKQVIAVEAWAPVVPPAPLGRPSLHDDVWGAPAPPIVPPENEYVQGLEEALAPGLRALPHFRGKNCDAFLELDAFATALMGKPVDVPPARMGRDDEDDSWVVDALPDAVARVLANTEDERLAEVMETMLSADEDCDDEARTFYVQRVLRPLRALAIEARRRGALVCHYWALHY